MKAYEAFTLILTDHLNLFSLLQNYVFCNIKNIFYCFLGIELPILSEAMPILSLFLRKNQRALKLSTLQLIDCLLKNYHSKLNVALVQLVTVEIPPLLDESDLHIAQWTLVILKSIALYHPRALADINNTIMPQVLLLVKSPLLQGKRPPNYCLLFPKLFILTFCTLFIAWFVYFNIKRCFSASLDTQLL